MYSIKKIKERQSKIMVLCDSGAHGKLKIYTHGHVYIVSIIMKVVYSEITSNIEIKNIIPYFLGAGWRI